MRRTTVGRWRSKATGALLLVVSLLIAELVGAPVPSTPRQEAIALSAAAAAADTPKPGGLEAQPTATGSFTHPIDITVPAFHGIQPRVSLDYDSGGGNGEVGAGWRLTVGSRIVRGGARGGLPRYDASDVFLLDDLELVACAPKCKTGGTHETRRQSFERFVFDGERWTRWQRDGVRLVYESPNEEPATAFQWPLARVVDTHGNAVLYSQDCPNHCFFDTITYGATSAPCGGQGEPACKAGAEIRFYYEQRPDIAVYPTGKGTKQIRQRLRTIAVRMDGRLVAAYALRYELSALTGNSLLRSVQQFPSDADVSDDGTVKVKAGATLPLPATTFTTASMSTAEAKWATSPTTSGPFASTSPPGQADFGDFKTFLPGNSSDAYCSQPCDEPAPKSPLYGDFNGDRRVDVASFPDRQGSCGPLYTRMMASPDEFGELTVTPYTYDDPDCPVTGYVSDVNGDGADDILLMTPRGTVTPAVSKRDGTFVINPQSEYFSVPWLDRYRRPCATGDLNGDGLGDLLCIYLSNLQRPRLGMLRSTPEGGWQVSDAPLPCCWPSLVVPDLLLATGDVDASTTSDIMLVGWREVHRPIGQASFGTVSLITGYTASDGTIASWSTTPTNWWRVSDDEWSISSADVDGDARADYVLAADRPVSHETEVFVATSEKGSQPNLVTKPTIPIAGSNVATGDVDGDGRADLMTGDPVGVLRSNGDGTFAERQSITTAWSDCSGAQNISGADVNGDGQADLICRTYDWDSTYDELFQPLVQPLPVAPPQPNKWQPFDKNGDGREDLYAVHYRNPGYEVYTLLGQPGGGYVASHEPILGGGGSPWTAEPDTSRWMPLDVGSPAGGPDGKSDLVRVGRDPCAGCSYSERTLSVTTLLATDSGWEPRYAQPWRVNGAAVPYGAVDTHAWRAAELNGDDQADFVHFSSLGTGVRVEYLLSNGDGSWTADHSDHFQSAATPGGKLTRQDVDSFRTVDLNRDGLSDFVHVEVGGGPTSTYRTIRSLVSNNPAAWEEETDRRFEPITSAAAHRLQAIDFEGDGVSDLGRAVVENGCVRVQAYLRQPGGWSTVQSAGAPSPCQAAAGAAGLDDRSNLVLADVNQDGRTDVYHLARVGGGATATNSISTLINAGDPVRNGNWRWVDQPGLPIPDPDAWAWIGLDTDHDGVGELAHIGGSSHSAFTTLRWGGGNDRLTSIDNGRGATTSIHYRAQPEARSYLPVGMLPLVVDGITVTDSAHAPPIVAAATFEYDGARWSTQGRKLLGYGTIRSKHAATVTVTGNDLTDACGARESSSAIETASGGRIAETTVNFLKPGASAPYTCLPKRTQQAECELAAECLVKQTDYSYDAYGNPKTVEESGGSLRRRTYTPVHPNTADYIVDRPYKTEVLVPNPKSPKKGKGVKWLLKARTLFGYDDDTWEHPPHQHGDLTRITAFSDITADQASDTFHEYDAAGNLFRTTDPAGVTTTIYDPGRHLFPTSTCTRVGCSTFTWDEVQGVVEAVTDANSQTTTTHHDAYGRATLTSRPDHSTTSTSYLNPGVVTGPDTTRQRVRTEVSDGSPKDGVLWQEDLIDGLGRVYRSLGEGVTTAPENVIVTDTRYADASDRVAASSTPHLAGQPPRWTTYAYDPAGRLSGVSLPGGTDQITRAYRLGAIEDRDQLDHLTTTHHDRFGRTTQVDEHVAPCPSCPLETLETHYAYDAMDRLVSTTDAGGHLTTIVRDDLGRETSITDPDRGTRTRTWRPDGTLDVETDANGTHTWTYDAAGRPSTRVDKDPTGTTQTASWDYDRDPASKHPQGYSAGRVTLVTYSTSGPSDSSSGTDRLWYDELGRVTRARHCVDAICQDMGYTYDQAGRVKNLQYPDPADPNGEFVKYTYDPAGRLTSVGGYLSGIQYDAAGQTTSQTYGNGLTERFTYDPDRLWLDTHTLTKPPTTLEPEQLIYAATYGHDPTARIDSLTTTNPTPATVQPVAETYAYDELGRLTTHTSGTLPAEAYRYDSLGRITQSPTGGTYHYDDPAHLHAATSTSAGHQRGYDSAGNLKTLTDPGGRSLQLTWTPTGMPESIANGQGLTTMAYGADGQRVKRSRTGEGTSYFFDHYLEQDGSGLTRYYWAGSQLIARRDPNGNIAYLLQDHLHSTRVVTDQNTAVAARYNYDPYGTERPDNQSDGTSQQLQGQRSEPDSGLVYMNARYYDPQLGQFTAPDSIIPSLYKPQSLNRYAFVRGDPINRWDPSGHADSDVEEKKNEVLHFDPVNITGDLPSKLRRRKEPPPPPPEPAQTSDYIQRWLVAQQLRDALSSRNDSAAPKVTDVAQSNMGGACSACHVPRFKPHTPTRRETLEALLPSAAATAPVLIVLLPEILGGAAAGAAGSATLGGASIKLGGGGAATLGLAPVAITGKQLVVAGVATSAGALALTAAMSAGPGGPQGHHIGTRYAEWANEFRPMFEKANLGLNDAENLVDLINHAGPHPVEYHFWVKMELEGATKGLSGVKYEQAFKIRLAEIAAELQKPGGSAMIKPGGAWWMIP